MIKLLKYGHSTGSALVSYGHNYTLHMDSFWFEQIALSLVVAEVLWCLS